MSDDGMNGINVALQTLLAGQRNFSERVDCLTTTVGDVSGQVVAVGTLVHRLDKGQTLVKNEVQRLGRRVQELEVTCGSRKELCDGLHAQVERRVKRISEEVGMVQEDTGRHNLAEVARSAAAEARQRTMDEAAKLASAKAAAEEAEVAREQDRMRRRGRNIRWAVGLVAGTLVAAVPVLLAYCS